MILRCAKCQKPLMRPYIQDGPQAWGPKCAKASGFTKPDGPRVLRQADHCPDAGQMILSLEPITAKQGRAYMHAGEKVIALDGTENPRLGVIGEPYFAEYRQAPASELVAMGQRYLQGGVPGAVQK
jgi:hypothetical protein